MTREHWLGIAIAAVTIVATLCLLALLQDAEGKVPITCTDPTERERVRDLAFKGIDDGFTQAVTLLFTVWQKDPETEQPRRAQVGMANAINAHARARKLALAWDPPICDG